MLEAVNTSFRLLDINLIQTNPEQPRQYFDQEALLDMVASIKTYGILLPLLVCREGEKYQLLTGERRLQAALQLKLKQVPVIERTVNSQQALELSLIENLQRQNLTPLEEALAYERLLKNYGLTQEAIAENLGKNRSTIANVLRLLKLPEEMKTALHEGKISPGHGKVLLSLSNKVHQYRLFTLIILKNLSVHEAYKLAKIYAKMKNVQEDHKGVEREQLISVWEDRLLHLLGSRVDIKGTSKKGKIIISYSSGKEFENLCSFFKDMDDDYSTY